MAGNGAQGIRHLALLGSTASGKTELAIELATRRRDVEIVSVDSMSVYRHMDIGTAKPSVDQRARVPHHLLDIVDPHEEFTLRQFQEAARAAISDLERRGKRAVLVAGTALYMRAIVDDLELPGRWPEVSARLAERAEEPEGLVSLYRRLEVLDPVAAARILPGNKRRVVRALEVTTGSGRRFSSFGRGLDSHPPTPYVLVGLPFEPETVDARIEARFSKMLDDGFLQEVLWLASRPEGISRTARQALGYRELLAHVEDGVSLQESVRAAISRTKSFARRQWRWFRRDPRVIWLDSSEDLLGQLLDVWDATAYAAVRD